MILASFLTIFFVFMVFYSAISVRRAIARYIILAVYFMAIFFVWNPNQTTIIANYFGIGRGLDFVLVIFSVAVLNGTVFIIRHLTSQHQNISRLVRHIAIRDALKPMSQSSAAGLKQ